MKTDLKTLKRRIDKVVVKHSPPFAELKSYNNNFNVTQEFIDTWVAPYFMELKRTDEKWVQFLLHVKNSITPDVVEKNLGAFNWRMRQTGAYLAALTNQTQFIDIIGVHLLKSEICYADTIYARVLAYFNTPKCVEYLTMYLDYYLAYHDLYFDQADVLQAVLYLDGVNGTSYYQKYLPQWEKFIELKLKAWHEPIETA